MVKISVLDSGIGTGGGTGVAQVLASVTLETAVWNPMLVFLQPGNVNTLLKLAGLDPASYDLYASIVVDGYSAGLTTTFSMLVTFIQHGAVVDPAILAIIQSGSALPILRSLVGPVGPTGPAGGGPTGAAGPTGPVGATGPAGGPQGPTGAHGATGPAGPVGPTGSVGSIGPQGPTGPIGPTGTGVAGSTGPAGPTGPRGATGPAGSQGVTGVTGPQGATGPSGVPTPPVDPFAGLDVESEHCADVGVEYGSTVSRWVDQRSYKHFVTFERDLALWYALGPNDEGVMTGTPSGGIRKGLGYAAVFDADGPAITPPGGLWSRSPLVLNGEEFTIALRIRLASGNGQSIMTICAPFPNGGSDIPKLTLRWTYAAGPSGQLELDITDTAVNSTTAVASMTHGSWHNVIIRHVPGVPDPLLDRVLVIRVDGVNGTPQSTATITDDLVPLDATSLGCDLEAANGTSPGFLAGGSAIRHILASPRAWSDAECLTAEAALTARWT